MRTAVLIDARIHHVDVSDDAITAHLVDGRLISVLLAWSWRVPDGTPISGIPEKRPSSCQQAAVNDRGAGLMTWSTFHSDEGEFHWLIFGVTGDPVMVTNCTW